MQLRRGPAERFRSSSGPADCWVGVPGHAMTEVVDDFLLVALPESDPALGLSSGLLALSVLHGLRRHRSRSWRLACGRAAAIEYPRSPGTAGAPRRFCYRIRPVGTPTEASIAPEVTGAHAGVEGCVVHETWRVASLREE